MRFLFELTLLNLSEFCIAVQTANADQLKAIAEILLNIQLFVPLQCTLHFPKKLNSLRKQLLKNARSVRLHLCYIFNEIVSCETLVMCTEHE